MKKRVLSVLLAVCLIVGILPLSASAAGGVEQKLKAAEAVWGDKTIYVDGWDDGCGTCFGFMRELHRYVFGTAIPRQWSLSTARFTSSSNVTEIAHLNSGYSLNDLKSLLTKAKPGDLLIGSKSSSGWNHGAVVRSVASGGAGVYVYDANWEKSNGKPLIRTNRYWTAENIRSNKPLAVTLYRASNYDAVNGSSSTPAPITPTPHTTHTKGTFLFWEAAHPHYNYYTCSVCGEKFTDGSTYGYYESCEICNPPKPANLSISLNQSSYTVGDTVTITPSASNTAYYAISIWDGGAYNSGNIVYSNWNFKGPVSFKPESAGTYNIRMDAVNSAGAISIDRVIQVSPAYYYLDVNGYLDSQIIGGLTTYGTCDVYINGKQVADDVTDYFTQWPTGTAYEIKDIRPNSGHSYNGIHSGNRSGTIQSDTTVVFDFSTINTASIPAAARTEIYNGHTYLFYHAPVTWYTAKAFCEKQGGHLVTISSSGENDLVYSLTGETYSWIGYSDIAKEGTWKWVTGESSKFQNWANNEPNNTDNTNESGENYAHICSPGVWNDTIGCNKLSFVCELDYAEEAEKELEDTDTPLDPTPENSFIDVPNGAYFAEAVNWAVEKGITAGTSSNTFSPNQVCTRAQAVTFLWRAAGSPEPSGSSTKFVDVASGQYYTKAIQWAVEKGITGGTSATTFSPNDKCTRAQIVTFQYRMHNSPAVSGVSPFADVPSSLYYANAVAWAVERGITSGTSASTFSPHNDCSRGQIVTFLYRDMA